MKNDHLVVALKGVSQTAAKPSKKQINLKKPPAALLASQKEVDIDGDHFVAYAPEIFGALREHYAIPRNEFRASWDNEQDLLINPTEGRSGSFFYQTEDKRYFLKTILKAEYKVLRSCLASYVKYMAGRPHTLLTKIFGLYSVATHYFIVFESFLPASFKGRRYDLKGRLPKREMPLEEPHLVKDNQILRKFLLSEGDADYSEVLGKDVAWLSETGLLDYSLFIGVLDEKRSAELGEKIDQEVALHPHRYNIYQAINPQTDRPETLFVGIIDILTDWNIMKVGAHRWKRLKFKNEELSTVKPQFYGDRFLKFAGEQIWWRKGELAGTPWPDFLSEERRKHLKKTKGKYEVQDTPHSSQRVSSSTSAHSTSDSDSESDSESDKPTPSKKAKDDKAPAKPKAKPAEKPKAKPAEKTPEKAKAKPAEKTPEKAKAKSAAKPEAKKPATKSKKVESESSDSESSSSSASTSSHSETESS